MNPLQRLFEPRTVALVGVSTRAGVFQVGARAVLHHLQQHGYRGSIALVSRSATEVDGVPAFESIEDLPFVPDCMLVAVRMQDVFETVQQALDFGVRAFVVVSSGFAESGKTGAEAQRRLSRLLRQHDALMLGPNTTGFVNVALRITLNSTTWLSRCFPRYGPVAVVSQSGALGGTFLDMAARDRIGISHLISTGNEAVLSLSSALDYLVDDPGTRVIAVYAEAIHDFNNLIGVAARARQAGKPLVIYKAGRSDVGRQAAAGHTGALVGSTDAWLAAVEQLGIVDVRNLNDLIPIASHLASPGNAARSIGVLTVSGGLGGNAADAIAADPIMRLPPPDEQTRTALGSALPDFLDVKNPLDVGGSLFREPGLFKRVLEAWLADPAYEAIVLANTPLVSAWTGEIVETVIALHEAGTKPIIVLWPAEIFNADEIGRLRDAGVPVFARAETLALAVHARARETLDKPATSLLWNRHAVGAVSANAISAGSEFRSLDEYRSKALLEAAGIPCPREARVPGTDLEAVVRAAISVGYPLVLKALVPDLIHKSDLGLVQTGLADEEGLREAVSRMKAVLEAKDMIAMSDFLIAEFCPPRAEIMAAISIDPEFGSMLTLGAGGIFANALRDVRTRLLPLSKGEIEKMLDSLGCAPLLHGSRGAPLLDIAALVAAISRLTEAWPALSQTLVGIEINPIGVLVAGRGVRALDATAFERITAPREESGSSHA